MSNTDSAGIRLVSSTATTKHQSSVPRRVNAHLSVVNICSLSAADVEKVVEAGMATTATTSCVCSLTVSAEECGIQTHDFETLHSMWVKAQEYLNSESDMPGPGSNKKSIATVCRGNYQFAVAEKKRMSWYFCSGQGVVTAMCPVLPSATAIKAKSKDQAHRRAAIKGSRYNLGNKLDQNRNKTPDFIHITYCHEYTVLSVLRPLAC